MKLDGTGAVVLGGARGIGKAYCEALLQKKAKVVCADVLEELGSVVEKELKAKYGDENFIFRKCNGSDETQIKDLLKFVQSHFGRLDIVVNNVGIVDEKNWQTVMDLNLGTTVRVTNATLELIGKDKGGKGGVLVHTASNGGLIPAFFAPLYCATKAAMVQYTRSWAHKINFEAHGVRMFTICPRMTDTDFLKQNADPSRVIKLDVLLKVMDLSDKNQMLKPSVVGDALIKGLEDDSLNGVALQLLTDEPRVVFADQDSLIVTRESVKTGEAQAAMQKS